MKDRELLEAAAKAAGKTIRNWHGDAAMVQQDERGIYVPTRWNPLADDADAFRLAVKLRLSIIHENEHIQGEDVPTIEVIGEQREDGSRDCVMHSLDDNPCAAVRRAIVRAAAALAQGLILPPRL